MCSLFSCFICTAYLFRVWPCLDMLELLLGQKKSKGLTILIVEGFWVNTLEFGNVLKMPISSGSGQLWPLLSKFRVFVFSFSVLICPNCPYWELYLLAGLLGNYCSFVPIGEIIHTIKCFNFDLTGRFCCYHMKQKTSCNTSFRRILVKMANMVIFLILLQFKVITLAKYALFWQVLTYFDFWVC